MGLSNNEIYKKFEELVAIDATSFSERKMADKLKEELALLGFEVSEDDAGKRYGGNAGNVYGYLKGDISGSPVLFSAHMDTVEPGNGKKAVIDENGRITSSGDTVLGGDDVCGIVEILFGVKNVLDKACENLGIFSKLVETFGGSDNNQFVKNEIHGIVLSCGMQEVHSVREYAYLQDIEMGARLVEELVSQND